MTKQITKWYKKMSFYSFIGYIVAPIAVTGEGAILTLDASPLWHLAVFFAVVISGYIKYMIKDEDNDGVADIYQKK